MTRQRSQSSHPTSRRPRMPDMPSTREPAIAGARGQADPLPRTGPHAALGAAHALDLAPLAAARRSRGGPGLADVLLELAGADANDVRAVLSVWQREQDRVVNRAWRRPGGLARPGGV